MSHIIPSVHQQIEEQRKYSATIALVDTPIGQVAVNIRDYCEGINIPAACYFGPAQRPAVYAAIDDERAYQIDKFGADKQQSVPGFLLIIENELNEAKAGWTKNLTGRHSVMHEIRQIAATCVAAMEKYGTSGSARATDDIPVD